MKKYLALLPLVIVSCNKAGNQSNMLTDQDKSNQEVDDNYNQNDSSVTYIYWYPYSWVIMQNDMEGLKQLIDCNINPNNINPNDKQKIPLGLVKERIPWFNETTHNKIPFMAALQAAIYTFNAEAVEMLLNWKDVDPNELPYCDMGSYLTDSTSSPFIMVLKHISRNYRTLVANKKQQKDTTRIVIAFLKREDLKAPSQGQKDLLNWIPKFAKAIKDKELSNLIDNHPFFKIKE